MTVPVSIQQPVDKALAQVQQDPYHQLPLFMRRQIYDAFLAFRMGELALAKLEILMVRYVLPFWNEAKMGTSWDGCPDPLQLVTIREDRLRGVPFSEESVSATSLAAEIVSLTGQDKRSPVYPTWCVFEAAVRSHDRERFNPAEHRTDADLIEHDVGNTDVAHLALMAYAGRIQTEMDDLSEQITLWLDSEADEPLPWTLTLDTTACLEFWEWWLLKAIPEAWQWASENLSRGVEDS